MLVSKVKVVSVYSIFIYGTPFIFYILDDTGEILYQFNWNKHLLMPL